jgi:hypothetical protein
MFFDNINKIGLQDAKLDGIVIINELLFEYF